MSNYKVVYTDNIYRDNELERQRFTQAGYDFCVASGHDEATLIRECADADAVMVSFAEINANVIAALNKCKVIIRCGMGVNNVDIPAATAKGIMVANVQKYCLEEVSDHAMALMLTLVRKTAYMSNLLRSGLWDPAKARPIPRIGELTLSLYGLGGISSRVAAKAKAFGMRVVAYDPYLPEEHFAKLGVERMASEDELLENADVFSIHLPLMASTANIITYEKLKKLKPNAIFLNLARGGLVEEEGLIRALREGVISGAGLDVLADEYPSMDHPLLHMDNVIVTPHIAYYSEGSDRDLRNLSIDQIIETMEQGAPRFLLNGKELNK